MLVVPILCVACAPSLGAEPPSGKAPGEAPHAEVARDAGSFETDAESLGARCALSKSTRDLAPSAPGPRCDASALRTDAVTFTTAPRTMVLDLYRPAQSAGALATVVWIHGGGWQSGSRAQVEQARWLACSGYAVASVEYRLSGEAVFPAQVHDVKAAIRFLRANASSYGLDPDRIAVFGSSAGGHLASLVALSGGVEALEDLSQGNPATSSRVRAGVDFYGPTDFADMDAAILAPGSLCPASRASHGRADSPESRLLGCAVADPACASRVAQANPITYVDASDPPLLVMHGSEDCTVPPAQSTRLVDALRTSGCFEHRNVAGAEHGGPAWTTEDVQNEVVAFLGKVLQ